jgi:7-alpha-hydroxysteroid dehydrogenase
LVTHKADVADEASANRIAELALEHFGTVHGLANVAGGIAGIGEDVIDRPIERIGLEEMRQTFRLNVDSAFLLTKALVPAFRAGRYGKIVNVASLAAFGNFDHMGNAAYDAAKAAVIGLTRTLSRSLGSDGIRVNVVAPGSIYTERVREVFSQEFLDAQIARIPLRRMPGPNDVAALIEFLLQPESDQISGEVMRVAGGLR